MERLASYWRRNQTTILLSVIAFCVFTLMGLMTVALNQLSVQLKAIDKNAQERSEQIEAIDRHLDCMTEFFAQTNRENKRIDDIDKCEIRRASQSKSGQINSPRTSPSTSTEDRTVASSEPQNSQPASEPARSSSPAPKASDKPDTPVEQRPPEQQPPEEETGLLRGLVNEVRNVLGGN